MLELQILMSFLSILLKYGRALKFQRVINISTCINLILNFLPASMGLILQGSPEASLASISTSMHSKLFQTAVVASISSVLPVFLLSILRLLFLSSKSERTCQNGMNQYRTGASALSLFLFVTPDLLVLLYGIPYSDVGSLHVILQARMSLLIWMTFSIINVYNKKSSPGMA